jgi:hypothetical protein
VGPSLEGFQAARWLGSAVGGGRWVVVEEVETANRDTQSTLSGFADILVEHRSCGGGVLVQCRPIRLVRLGITKYLLWLRHRTSARVVADW